ncbi:hypothetical protein D1007_27806 [Hordeum vulgare]|nr:hypothetical protein D1007_27806 [Hordeum vulgare]
MRDLLAAGAFRRGARRPWALTDSKCHIGDRDNATTAHAVTSQGGAVKVTFELADPPGVSRCFVHCPGQPEGRYAGDPVVVSSADAFVLLLLVVPFADGRTDRNEFFVYRAGPGPRVSTSSPAPTVPPTTSRWPASCPSTAPIPATKTTPWSSPCDRNLTPVITSKIRKLNILLFYNDDTYLYFLS